jgi:hypothetical protein
MNPDVPLDSLDFIPPNHAGMTGIFVVGVLFLGLGVAAGIVFMVSRVHALRAARAREIALLDDRSKWPLSQGPLRMVHGRVERDEPAGSRGRENENERESESDALAEIDIHQVVSNHSNKNARWHVWTETSRDARAQPFFIVHDGDQRAVYVEATSDLLIVDALATTYPDSMPNARIRAAKVKHGESIYAYGDLFAGQHHRAGGGGYRDGGTGWVLRAPRGGRMLLATEAMRGRYDARMKLLTAASAVLGVLWLAFHIAFTLPAIAATCIGTFTTAHVTNTRIERAKTKNGYVSHYMLDTETSDGLHVTDEVPYRTWSMVKTAREHGERVDAPLLRVGDSDYASFIGRRAHTSVGALAAGCIAAIFACVIIVVTYRKRYAWYDQKKLVESGGDGHWIETRPITPIPSSRN